MHRNLVVKHFQQILRQFFGWKVDKQPLLVQKIDIDRNDRSQKPGKERTCKGIEW